MYRIKTQALTALYAAMAAENDLFLPVKAAGKTNFALWQPDADVDIRTLKAVKSPKDVFFPQSENLYTCERTDGKLAVEPQTLREKPFVVFGIRACDVRGIAVLDKVFLSRPVDTYYAARRKCGVLVSLACSRPETSCFCGAFGIDCAAPEGDVAAWLAGEYLYWQPRTEKGAALTGQIESLLEPCDDAPVAAEQAAIRDICRKLPLKDLSLANWGADAAQRNFDSPIWECTNVSITPAFCGTP